MRTSNPPSYDKIFSIYTASGTALTDSVVSTHRGLLLINTSATTVNTAITKITNIDGTTTGTIAVAPGATILPLQIWKISVSLSAGLYIYGLV